MDIRLIFSVALGLSFFMILTANVLLPYWATAGGLNITSTGLSSAAWQGLLLVIVLGGIFAIVYSIIGRNKS